jgi:hypothetical protein
MRLDAVMLAATSGERLTEDRHFFALRLAVEALCQDPATAPIEAVRRWSSSHPHPQIRGL